ncbi:universal stress protein [Nocardiopsis coralliicola]
MNSHDHSLDTAGEAVHSTGEDAAAGVVVGVDGSEGGRHALAWAARAAQRRGSPLTLLVAVSMPLISVPFGSPVRLTPTPEAADRAATLLRAETEHVTQACPDLEVRTSVSAREPAPALIRASRTADLVVVGSRGLGGVRAAFLGSVSLRVSAHGQCPVAVVPHGFGPEYRPHYRAVVGVDGSPDSAEALRYALAEAARKSASVTVVRAWQVIPPPDPVMVEMAGYAAERQAASSAAADATRAMVEEARTEATSGVEVDVQVVEDQPAHALIAASSGADMIIVGSRGHGGFAGLLLGSVSQTLLHHATVPVVISRRRA